MPFSSFFTAEKWELKQHAKIGFWTIFSTPNNFQDLQFFLFYFLSENMHNVNVVGSVAVAGSTLVVLLLFCLFAAAAVVVAVSAAVDGLLLSR